jgi:hypothetical protein
MKTLLILLIEEAAVVAFKTLTSDKARELFINLIMRRK